MKDDKTIHSPDAVIVLANLMDQDGTLNGESSARAAKAVEVFEERRAGFLVTCGWPYRKDSPISIADAFCKHILACSSVPHDRILVERNSRDTVGDAYFTKTAFATPRCWKSIVVITSDYHVPRTRHIFEFIYGPETKVEVLGAQVSHDDGTLENEKKSMNAFRATFEGVRPGDDGGALQALRKRHPFYNGAVYPTI